MKAMTSAFRTGRAERWTRERLQDLGREELKQLRANAERLAEAELASLCDELLTSFPARGASGRRALPPKIRARLVPRASAMEARGVGLHDHASWSGVRTSDGTVVFALWAQAVESRRGGCRCLLWAPNVAGCRPWSDTAAGKERLEHCKLAVQKGSAEGLLVHGEALTGRPPEERARTVYGVDPEITIRFRVEQRGAEYWAAWGKATA
jgi:hypothetical protein